MLKTFSRKKIHAAVILNFLSRLSESSERQRTKSGTTVAKPPIAGSDKRKLNRKKKKKRDGINMPVSKVRDDRITNLPLFKDYPAHHNDLETSNT